jgi:hypothetical protein
MRRSGTGSNSADTAAPRSIFFRKDLVKIAVYLCLDDIN